MGLWKINTEEVAVVINTDRLTCLVVGHPTWSGDTLGRRKDEEPVRRFHFVG